MQKDQIIQNFQGGKQTGNQQHNLANKKNKFQQLRELVDQQVKQKWENQQLLIKKHIVQKDQFQWDVQTLQFVAGVDLSASKQNPDLACVALIVYNCKKKEIAYQDLRLITIEQPYIPGFLAFREIPSLYRMLTKLKLEKPQVYPQLILVDGNGILHPNQCGLASHLGVLVNTPTIGIGKTLFYIDGLDKETVKILCKQQIKKQGDYCYLKGKSGRIWGAGLRNTFNSTNPVFVSVGTKISLDTGIECIMKLSQFRVVEPIRLADKMSREIIQKCDIEQLKKEGKFQTFQMVYLQEINKNKKQT